VFCILRYNLLQLKGTSILKNSNIIKQYIQFFIIFLLLFTLIFHVKGQLVINEVVSCNNSGIVDGSGSTPDWVEIFNTSDEGINLSTYFLSDNISKPQKWRFPNVRLNPKSFLILYASGKNISTPAEIHTNFKIDADGETLILSNATHKIHDLHVDPIVCNQSIGYLNDQSDSLVVFRHPTPGYPNSETGVEIPLIFSHDSGFYTEQFNLNINTTQGVEIRYTLNSATNPTFNSDLYSNPITIKSRSGQENVFSEIQTTDTTAWKTPKDEVFKINVIRAAAFVNHQQVGKVYTRTYGISPLGSKQYTFPIVSLVAEPHQLFSDTAGIYVLGNNYLTYNQPNFNYDWDRDVFVEFFESNGLKVLSQHAKIEIAGQTTRWRRQKSLKLKAAGKGNKNRFEYPFFNTDFRRYKTLILRSPFADYRKSFIKDQFVNAMAGRLDLANADCKPVVVFLNGEYWGIHILQEKQDKYYLEDHYKVDKDSVHLLVGNATESYEIIEGAGEEYLELRNYADTNDLSIQHHFDYVDSHININNFIDYYCFQMLIAMRDWPWNNMKYWRPTDNSRKWEWIPYDFDSAYNYPESDVFQLASEAENESVAWSVLLFNNLMANDSFKQQLLSRLEELLNTEFCSDAIIPKIEAYQKHYEPEVAEHLNRWNFDETYSWEEELEVYYRFPKVIAKIIKRIVEEDFEYDMQICDMDTTEMTTSVQEIIDEAESLFHTYPNPASNIIQLNFEAIEDDTTFFISDLTGKVYLKTNTQVQTKQSLNISTLPIGIYIVHTNNSTPQVIGRFIKIAQ